MVFYIGRLDLESSRMCLPFCYIDVDCTYSRCDKRAWNGSLIWWNSSHWSSVVYKQFCNSCRANYESLRDPLVYSRHVRHPAPLELCCIYMLWRASRSDVVRVKENKTNHTLSSYTMWCIPPVCWCRVVLRKLELLEAPWLIDDCNLAVVSSVAMLGAVHGSLASWQVPLPDCPWCKMLAEGV